MDMESNIETVRRWQQHWSEMNKPKIIMVKAELNTRYNYTVYGVDPESGAQRVISEFSIPTSVIANADGSKWQTYPMFIPGFSTRLPLRGMFSRDYQYLAVTRYSLETGEYRAGYYKEGEGLYYTDISKSVGAVGGDFDEPVKQMAIGFTEDGRFIFADMPSVPGWYYDTSEWECIPLYSTCNRWGTSENLWGYSVRARLYRIYHNQTGKQYYCIFSP